MLMLAPGQMCASQTYTVDGSVGTESVLGLSVTSLGQTMRPTERCIDTKDASI